jgi:hypothetical protein
MNNSSDDASAPQPSRSLVHVALAVWLVSLVLPGFVVESRGDTWFGAYILLLGPLFGWMVNGWAVYANVFFLFALTRLYQGRSPKVSVVAMLLLAATLPLFSGVLQDEGSGTVLPVGSWGWGAALWLCALILLAGAAAIRAGLFPPAASKVIPLVLAVLLVPVLLVHQRQWQAANAQERQLYLPIGVAFTRADFCGVPFTWPSGAVVPPDAVVGLDIDAGLHADDNQEPRLRLPALLNFEENGFDWVGHREPGSGSVTVQVRSVAQPKRYMVQVRKTGEGAVVRVIDTRSKAALYEQTFKVQQGRNGHASYCPMSKSSGEGALTKSFDRALLRALGQDRPAQPPQQPLRSELARTPCDLDSADIDGIKGLHSWDGRQVILQPESIRTRPGYCSEHYIALAYLSTMSDTGHADLSSVVMIFDRLTLKPLAAFNDRRTCSLARCPEVSPDIIKGVLISDGTATVETTAGSFAAQRIKP